MPLPNPHPEESKNEWMHRCMSNDAMQTEFPEQDQRLGVCYTQWRRHSKIHRGIAAQTKLVEALAAFIHDEQWCGWAKHMLANWQEAHPSGESYQDRWRREAETLYQDLSEDEKEADRQEASKVLEFLQAYRLTEENHMEDATTLTAGLAPLFSVGMGRKAVADLILRHVPEHKHYIEAFAGAARILLAKQPADRETIIEKHPERAWVWRTVKTLSDADIKELASRNWLGSKGRYELIKGHNPVTRLGRLYRFLYLSYFSFGGVPERGWGHWSTPKQRDPGRLATKLTAVRERLANVEVLEGDALDLLPGLASEDSFVYCDPPFHPSAVPAYFHRAPWDPVDFPRLFEVLRGLKGKFLLNHPVCPEIEGLRDGLICRSITRRSDTRKEGEIQEYLIANYALKDVPILPSLTITDLPLEEAVSHFSSTQVDLPADVHAAMIAFGQTIPDDHLAADGRERDPHITIKYGLHTDNPQEVQDVLNQRKEEGITLELGATGVFPGDSERDYDVVKVDVLSPGLQLLNHTLANLLDCEESQWAYSPHATIAYVKKGLGELYTGVDLFGGGHEVAIDHVIFSGKDGKQTRLPFVELPPSLATFSRLSQAVQVSYLLASSPEKRHPIYVRSVILEPDNRDSEGRWASAEEVQKAFTYIFNKDSQKGLLRYQTILDNIGVNHDDLHNGDADHTPGLELTGFTLTDTVEEWAGVHIPAGSLVAELCVTSPQIQELIRQGRLTGLSMEAEAETADDGKMRDIKICGLDIVWAPSTGAPMIVSVTVESPVLVNAK